MQNQLDRQFYTDLNDTAGTYGAHVFLAHQKQDDGRTVFRQELWSVKALAEASERFEDTYMTMCSYTTRYHCSRSRENIKSILGFAIDVDINEHQCGTSISLEKAQQMASIIREQLPCDILPTHIIASGAGLHFYWMLKRSMNAMTFKDCLNHKERDPLEMYDQAASRLHRLLQSAIHRAGMDDLLHACAKTTANCIIRMPGSWNSKRESTCTVIWSDSRQKKDFFSICNWLYSEDSTVVRHEPIFRHGESVPTDSEISMLAESSLLDHEHAEKFMHDVPEYRRGTMEHTYMVRYINDQFGLEKRPQIKKTRMYQEANSHTDYYDKALCDIREIARYSACTDRRNLMCYYSAIFAYKAGGNASNAAIRLNNCFQEPLEKEEIEHLVRNAIRNASDIRKNIYHFKKGAILNAINVTPEEISAMEQEGAHFCILNQAESRRRAHSASSAKKQTAKRKKARNTAHKRQMLINRAHELHGKGISTREIAKRLGICQKTVITYLKKMTILSEAPEKTSEEQPAISDVKNGYPLITMMKYFIPSLFRKDMVQPLLCLHGCLPDTGQLTERIS